MRNIFKHLLWVDILIVAVAIPFIGFTIYSAVFKQASNRTQQLAIAEASTDSENTYKTYLEAPVSPKYYAPKPKLVVKATSVTYAPRILPISTFTQPLIEILRYIAKCESGNNPLARNPTSSAKGLLQIIDGTWKSFQCEGYVLNADDNFNCGIKIASQSGLHHWDASRACWGKQVQ
jgi:hypothetical protein